MVKPTYTGKNDALVFIAPTELFSMSLGPIEKIDRETAKVFSKYLKGTFKGFEEARKTKLGNETNTNTKTSPEFWESFEKIAKDKGVDLVGYTPVNEKYIFKDFQVYGKNAIVFGMEMKWDKIKTAPGATCEMECFRVYDELGKATIDLTNYLKDKGYKSEAHHPFGGKLLFTAHAVAANLGIMGRNGLIITPEFGPRQRWSIITTDAEIPNTLQRNFDDMKEFCETCGSCVKNCKGGAAFEKPIEREKGSGIIMHIDRSKCIQSLMKNNYCSVCLKICPQGRTS